ncbi:MAG TPA: glycosyltransferase [bacterium]|nr:glycosyltransferase [bacterium]
MNDKVLPLVSTEQGVDPAGESKQSPARRGVCLLGKLTILVPAYNEAGSLADTIRSLKAQTVPIHEIIVIDDRSTDGTDAVARSLGVTVVTPPQNTGSKAGAQNFALKYVFTEFALAIDADTTLAPDAIEKLLASFDDPRIVAACGFVIPRHVKTVWERGRYIEYLFAFSFCKQIQDYFGKPLISSGCFSMYRTEVLRETNGWPTRTVAEDMDLTWTFYSKGYGVRFIPDAVCYPIEPHNYHFMGKQLKRWSHGFVQNLMIHWDSIRQVPYLNSMAAVIVWDAIIASAAYMVILPLLAVIFRNPIFLIGYVIDVPAVLVPVLAAAIPRGETGRALASVPAYFVLRTVNAVFMIKAFWNEIIRKKTLKVYEKGH